MFKSLGIMAGGIFVGALGMEMFRRKCPNALDTLCTKTSEVASSAVEAFKAGYQNVAQPRTATAPDA